MVLEQMAQEQAVTVLPKKLAIPEEAGRSIRVLMVEDDPDSAALTRVLLGKDTADPFEVEWHENLMTALMRLAEPGIDVVLLDLGLPELSGYKSLRAIEIASSYSIPVVIFTADDSKVTRDLTVGYGAFLSPSKKPRVAGFLVKQKTSPVLLRQTLRNAVRREC